MCSSDLLAHRDGTSGVSVGSPPPTPSVLGRIISRLLFSISAGTRPILIMEDLHDFDPQSLLLLEAFLNEVQNPFTVLLTSRPEGIASTVEMFDRLRPSLPHRLLDLPLGPLEPAETLRFCLSFLPEALVLHKGLDYFVRESEGVPLLLTEILQIGRAHV